MSTKIAESVSDALVALNGLPSVARTEIYARLVPTELLLRLGIDLGSRRGPSEDPVVRVSGSVEAPWARVEVRRSSGDRDAAFTLVIQASPLGGPELAFVGLLDPSAPRFGIDQGVDGRDTLLGTMGRNVPEEIRALEHGLGPGQVRRGLGLLGAVLERMDAFSELLGSDFYLVEPLFYHSALLYERHGCAYFSGLERMEAIDAGFAPGGPLWRRLDGSTRFRRAEAATSGRGRSWAIHDGVLGEPFGGGPIGIKMFRAVGRPARVSTFQGGRY